MSASKSKAAHYEQALSDALAAGAWADATPARSIKGDAISWAELERKLAKHSGDSIAGELASHLLSLSLLLSAPSIPLPETSVFPHHTPIHRSRPVAYSEGSLATVADLDGDEPLELARHVQLATKGREWARLTVGEDGRSLVEQGLKDMQALRQKAKQPSDQESADVLTAQYHIALGQITPALALLSPVPASPPPTSAPTAVWVQRVRALVLLGTCCELSTPANLDRALDAYGLAVKIYEECPGLSLPAAGSKPVNAGTFGRLRELHRWAERAFSRLCFISSSSPTSHSDTLRWLQLWASFEQIYPPAFRPQRRLALRLLHLRALAVARPPGWKSVAHRIIKRGSEALKGEGRPFPSAGETRHDLEEWAECCVGIWRAAGEPQLLGADVSQVLWWTTTQTFASQPTLRHLTRVLLALNPEDPTDARRTFKLYVQLVTKARETARGDTSIAHDSSAATPAPPTPAAEKVEGEIGPTLIEEGDDDRTFFEALLFGAHMAGRNCGEPKEGLSYLDQAKAVLAESTDGSLTDAALRLELEGVWEQERGCLLMALLERVPDPTSRPTVQAEALKHLLQASVLLPSSARTFFVLAHAQVVCRQVDEATVAIQSALELDPGMVEGWHLLALILTAKGKWAEAAEIVEVGIDTWEEEDEDDLADIDGTDSLVARRDYADEKQGVQNVPDVASGPILPGGRLPVVKSFFPRTISTIFLRTTAFAKLEAFLQLRMTQAVLLERLEGPDEALELQQANFAFFSVRCGRQVPLPRAPGQAGSLKSVAVAPVTNLSIVVDGDSHEKSVLLVDSSKPIINGEKAYLDRGALGHGRDPSSTATGPSTINDQDPIEQQFAMVSSSSATPNTGSSETVVLTDPFYAVNPPTPDGSRSAGSYNLAVEDSTSPGGSGTVSPASSDSPVRSERSKPRFLPRHLAPHGNSRRLGGGLGRSASLSKLAHLRHPSESKNASEGSLRSFSNASSIHLRSQRQSPTASTYEGSRTPPPPSLLMTSPSGPVASSAKPLPGGSSVATQTAREARLLSSLWLMSAATFRRRGKLEQALGAIQEAEVLDQTNPEVWVQLGLYHDVLSAPDQAIAAFLKGLVYHPGDLSCLVHLARLYLVTPPLASNGDLAHGLLHAVTQGPQGWDSAEAWFFLAKACERQDGGTGARAGRRQECLAFAAKLEEGRTARHVGIALGRWV